MLVRKRSKLHCALRPIFRKKNLADRINFGLKHIEFCELQTKKDPTLHFLFLSFGRKLTNVFTVSYKIDG